LAQVIAPRLVAVFGVGVVDAGQPVVCGDDLGLTRGDGCFDATRVVVDPDGTTHIDHLDAHLARFARSAAALDLGPVDLGAWHELIHESVAAWTHPGEALLRVILTRGREIAPAAPATGLLTIAPIDDHTMRAPGHHRQHTRSGHAADAFSDVPWLLGGVKTLSYAVNVAAGREASRRGVDEVLFVSSDGYALEAPRAALIWRIGDRLHTTRHEGTGILASITQTAVFGAAADDGIATSYDLIRIVDLPDVDGAWLASSGRGVAPITALDGRPLATDRPWTSRLWGWFAG
jgi:4-amino-4-deoxychorismate lyase